MLLSIEVLREKLHFRIMFRPQIAKYMHKSSTILSLFICLVWSLQLNGQGTQTEFGKNRVQHHQEFAEWLLYESPNFITYWYGEGRNVGQSVVQMAEMDFADIRLLSIPEGKLK